MQTLRSSTSVVRTLLVAACLSCGIGSARANDGPEVVEYKQSVATRIFNAAKATLTKAPVKALSVVGYTIDASGNLLDAWIVRSAGERSLDDRAISMLQRSVPLPTPPVSLFASDPHTHLSEAFVFTVDGKFRLQSLIR